MKKVVVKGKDNELIGLLTARDLVKFYRKKGLPLFVYEKHTSAIDLKPYFYLVSDKDLEHNSNSDNCNGYVYSKVDHGDKVVRISAKECLTGDEMKLTTYREDSDLIDLVNEINDKDYVNIIEIPDDVEYDLLEEYNDIVYTQEAIVERHRVWMSA